MNATSLLGFPVIIKNLQESDILLFDGQKWSNYPEGIFPTVLPYTPSNYKSDTGDVIFDGVCVRDSKTRLSYGVNALSLVSHAITYAGVIDNVMDFIPMPYNRAESIIPVVSKHVGNDIVEYRITSIPTSSYEIV